MMEGLSTIGPEIPPPSPERLFVIASARRVKGGFHAFIRWRRDGKDFMTFVGGRKDTRTTSPVYATQLEAVRAAWAEIEPDLAHRYRVTSRKDGRACVTFGLSPW
jgi:hypothetical protein